jgi:hypothetical protein
MISNFISANIKTLQKEANVIDVTIQGTTNAKLSTIALAISNKIPLLADHFM